MGRMIAEYLLHLSRPVGHVQRVEVVGRVGVRLMRRGRGRVFRGGELVRLEESCSGSGDWHGMLLLGSGDGGGDGDGRAGDGQMRRT